MKKNKKKKSLLKKLKEKLRGFTLVELLAVIVILAVIMIVAIPSVLDTLETAKQKSFLEYAEKISTKATEQIIITDEIKKIPSLSDEDTIVYDIKTDFGLDSTGDYNGYIIRTKFNHECGTEYACYYHKELDFLVLWDNEYFLAWDITADGIPTTNRKWEDTDSIFNSIYDDEVTGLYQTLGKKVGDSILISRSEAESCIQSALDGSGITISFDDFDMKEFIVAENELDKTKIKNGYPPCRWWSHSFISIDSTSSTGYNVFYSFDALQTECYTD